MPRPPCSDTRKVSPLLSPSTSPNSSPVLTEEPLNFLDARISKLKSEFFPSNSDHARVVPAVFVFFDSGARGVGRSRGREHAQRTGTADAMEEGGSGGRRGRNASRSNRGKPRKTLSLSLSLFLSASSTRRRRRRRRSDQRSDGRRPLHSQPSRSSLALWPRGRRVPARGVPMTSS